MSDLISRKAVINKLHKKADNSTGDTRNILLEICQSIFREPTAYSVDEVVKQLQRSSHNYYPSIDSYCLSEKAVKLKDVINIVKGAVKDE